jgi:hypothetical protein
MRAPKLETRRFCVTSVMPLRSLDFRVTESVTEESREVEIPAQIIAMIYFAV